MAANIILHFDPFLFSFWPVSSIACCYLLAILLASFYSFDVYTLDLIDNKSDRYQPFIDGMVRLCMLVLVLV